MDYRPIQMPTKTYDSRLVRLGERVLKASSPRISLLVICHIGILCIVAGLLQTLKNIRPRIGKYLSETPKLRMIEGYPARRHPT